MEEFERLSISDSSSLEIVDNDLQMITNLKIGNSESKHIDKFSIHQLSQPSPLQQVITSDDMDIDEEDPVVDDLDLLDDADMPDQTFEVEAEEEEEPTLVQKILSPTSQGIAAAIRDPVASCDDLAPKELKDSAVQTSSEVMWNNKPVQLSINNHYYNYPTYEGSKLPAPWSHSSHPQSKTPYLMMSYLQLFSNGIYISFALAIFLSFLKTVKSDISARLKQTIHDLEHESFICQMSYDRNQCDPSIRRPALEDQCNEWFKCMKRDNTVYGSKSLLSAELLGDVLNSFIKPIGWKAIAICVCAFFVWFYSSNFALGYLRAKSYYGWKDERDEAEKKRAESMDLILQ